MKNESRKIWNAIKENKGRIVFLIALIGFVAIMEFVFEQEILKLDIVAHEFLVKELRNDALTKFMYVITNMGGVIALVLISVFSLIVLKKKEIAVAICSNLACVSMLNVILKNIIQRPRPEGYRLITESGYSFPSGHSMINTAFYGLLIYFIYKNFKNKYIKGISCILLGNLILLIAISRVYLGVHYASDVIAGFLLAISYLICFIKLYNATKSDDEKISKEKLIKRFAKIKSIKLINSFKYAFCGLKSAYKREQNLKIHVVVMCLVILAGFVFRISMMEWCVCALLFAIIISEELINTAIEVVVDIAMPKINSKAKIAKDVAASAVLVSSIFAVIIGLIIFVPKILELIIK